uniref:phosphoserine transaminase n=1 Tax=Heterorhabditis bacteriophora TaxID=37862 RepID=A0A1I7X3R3_HETBA
MSHRSKEFAEVLEETKSLFRDVMSVPDNFEIMFMHGGGTGQFAAIPLNLKHTFADYIVTGAWSGKAAQEAEKFIHVKRASIKSDAAYLYYCANETVHGIEFHEPPHSIHGVPLVADISSNFLSRPFDFRHHGVVFGGTQKNLGAAGITIAMVRKDLIGKQLPITPAVFSYKEMQDNNSLYNTPAVYGIYITNLVLKWIRDQGGVEAIYETNLKANMIYNIIDSSNGFYHCAIDKRYRSNMNVCFRIGGESGDDAKEAEFLKGAAERHMISLKGHRINGTDVFSRSVGGIRASLYNAVTLSDTEVLATWMNEFLAKYS